MIGLSWGLGYLIPILVIYLSALGIKKAHKQYDIIGESTADILTEKDETGSKIEKIYLDYAKIRAFGSGLTLMLLSVVFFTTPFEGFWLNTFALIHNGILYGINAILFVEGLLAIQFPLFDGVKKDS